MTVLPTTLFRLHSSDGQDDVTGISLRTLQLENGIWYCSSLRMSGNSYCRADSIQEGVPIRAPVADYMIELGQVMIPRTALLDLRDLLIKWAVEPGPLESVLASANEQRLSFSLGARCDFISSAHRPVAVIRYGVHRVETEVRFVVDQSCVAECAATIDLALAG